MPLPLPYLTQAREPLTCEVDAINEFAESLDELDDEVEYKKLLARIDKPLQKEAK